MTTRVVKDKCGSKGAIEMRMWAASEAAEEEQGIEGRQLDIKPEDKGSISNHPGEWPA